jgi:S-adenosylmethionine:tRNA ribosyltransferase-isomerase
VVGTTSLRTLETLYWLGVKVLADESIPPGELILSQWEAYGLRQDIPVKSSFCALLKWMDDNNVPSIETRTRLLIAPGYSFQVADGLITNFHQPGSTLLLLVAAFAGDGWKKIYTHALEHGYRFLSYGDGSLLWRSNLSSAGSRQ